MHSTLRAAISSPGRGEFREPGNISSLEYTVSVLGTRLILVSVMTPAA
jgi:hypothetical protein